MLSRLSIPVVAWGLAVTLIESCLCFILVWAVAWGIKKANERPRKKHDTMPPYISAYGVPTSSQNKPDYRPRVGLDFELSVVADLQNHGYTGIFHDVNIECEFGRAQLDVILVNGYAVYVIECKNWAGKVFGDSDWHRWVKIDGFRPMGRYGADKSVFLRATELYNPIYQNNWHIRVLSRCLQEILGFTPTICNIVVFCDQTDISDVHDRQDGRVIHKARLVSVLNENELEFAEIDASSLNEYRERICLFLKNNSTDRQSFF